MNDTDEKKVFDILEHLGYRECETASESDRKKFSVDIYCRNKYNGLYRVVFRQEDCAESENHMGFTLEHLDERGKESETFKMVSATPNYGKCPSLLLYAFTVGGDTDDIDFWCGIDMALGRAAYSLDEDFRDWFENAEVKYNRSGSLTSFKYFSITEWSEHMTRIFNGSTGIIFSENHPILKDTELA